MVWGGGFWELKLILGWLMVWAKVVKEGGVDIGIMGKNIVFYDYIFF